MSGEAKPARNALEGAKVPDKLPPVPLPADVVRVDPAVTLPWAREARRWAAGVLVALALLVAAAAWAALEQRWMREEADARLRAEKQQEANDADEQRR